MMITKSLCSDGHGDPQQHCKVEVAVSRGQKSGLIVSLGRGISIAAADDILTWRAPVWIPIQPRTAIVISPRSGIR